VDGLSNVVYVLGIEADHCDSAVFQHVDMVGIDKVEALVLVETCKGKHADLISNMIPSSRGFQFF
jgi:hypothetical protein